MKGVETTQKVSAAALISPLSSRSVVERANWREVLNVEESAIRRPPAASFFHTSPTFCQLVNAHIQEQLANSDP